LEYEVIMAKSKHSTKKGQGRKHYQGQGKDKRNKEYNRGIDGTLK